MILNRIEILLFHAFCVIYQKHLSNSLILNPIEYRAKCIPAFLKILFQHERVFWVDELPMIHPKHSCSPPTLHFIIFQKRLKLEFCSITLCHKFTGFVNLDSESTEWSKIGGGTIKVRVRESIWIITTYSPIHKILSCKIAPNWPIWKKGSVARERCLYLRIGLKHTAHFTAFYIFSWILLIPSICPLKLIEQDRRARGARWEMEKI